MVDIENLCRIAGTRENERVISVLHRHWFNIATHLLGAVLLALGITVGFFLFPTLFPEAFSGANAFLPSFIENTFFLVLWVYVFLVWIDVYFDVWVITNERIINIEQKGLFNREISEVSFSKVQDVTSEVEGIIPSVLDYGDVFVQSAGTTERFRFRSVPNPVGVKDLIMKFSQGAKADDLEDAVGILEDMQRHKRS